MGNVEEFILSQKTCTLVLLLINYLNLPQLFNTYMTSFISPVKVGIIMPSLQWCYIVIFTQQLVSLF